MKKFENVVEEIIHQCKTDREVKLKAMQLKSLVSYIAKEQIKLRKDK